MLKRFQYSLCLVFISLFSLSLAASPNLNTIQTGKHPMMDIQRSTKESAQIRIPIELKPFEKVLVYKNKEDRNKSVDFRNFQTLRHVLRARMDRTNQFYFGDWHVETSPLKWRKNERSLKLKLSFYKRYGEGKELEEFVGSLEVNGLVQDGEKGFFKYNTYAKHTFTNKKSQPLVEVSIGESSNQILSKSKTDTKKF